MINFQLLLDRMRLLAVQYPDRQTQGIYWDYTMDMPECLVGTAIDYFEKSVPLEKNGVVAHRLPWTEWGFTEPFGPQLRWLSLVQTSTDAGATWGMAIANADATFPWGKVA